MIQRAISKKGIALYLLIIDIFKKSYNEISNKKEIDNIILFYE